MIDISCVMSVYNESVDMVLRAIHSMLYQTYSIREFVIIFDNPDRKELFPALNQVVSSHQEVEWKLIVNKKNIGLAASLNRGIKAAKFDYIARMDADDEAFPNRLKDSVQLIMERGLKFVTTKVLFVDEEGRPVEKMRGMQLAFPSSVDGNRHIGKYNNPVYHSTWLFLKTIWERIGGYREQLYTAQDYDFFLRSLNAGFDVGTTRTVGLRYTVRKESITGRYKSIQTFLATYIQFYQMNRLAFDRKFVEDVKAGINLDYNVFRPCYLKYLRAENWLIKGMAVTQGICMSKYFRIAVRNALCALTLSFYYRLNESKELLKKQ